MYPNIPITGGFVRLHCNGFIGEAVRALPRGEIKETCILIVDDHERMRSLLREWLEIVFPGCTVIEAVSGEEAVVLAKAQLPNLVIMDISLPQMSGIEATRLIRETVPASNVVMLTMYEDEAHRADAFSAGASDYVPKRLMQVALLPTLTSLLTTNGNGI
jgi:DNA-binding NarL/FixJ family response regulator